MNQPNPSLPTDAKWVEMATEFQLDEVDGYEVTLHLDLFKPITKGWVVLYRQQHLTPKGTWVPQGQPEIKKNLGQILFATKEAAYLTYMNQGRHHSSITTNP